MADSPIEEVRDYVFSAAEAPLVRAAMNEAQSKLDVMHALVRLVQAQQGLPGTWTLKADGSGLAKA